MRLKIAGETNPEKIKEFELVDFGDGEITLQDTDGTLIASLRVVDGEIHMYRHSCIDDLDYLTNEEGQINLIDEFYEGEEMEEVEPEETEVYEGNNGCF